MKKILSAKRKRLVTILAIGLLVVSLAATAILLITDAASENGNGIDSSSYNEWTKNY